MPVLRQASSTLTCTFLRRSQLLSELFIHRRHSEPTGTAKAAHVALWMASEHTNRPTVLVQSAAWRQSSGTLTDVVGSAELYGDHVLHVAMETEEELDGINFHLHSAGQVHHLRNTHTHKHTELTCCLGRPGFPPPPPPGATLRSSGGCPSTIPYQDSSLCQASAGTSMKSSFSTRRSLMWNESRSGRTGGFVSISFFFQTTFKVINCLFLSNN